MSANPGADLKQHRGREGADQRTYDMSGERPPAPARVVFPTSTEEVRSVVAEGRPFYVISRGRNWGYGERAVMSPGAVLIDLSRMNRILEVNERLGYVVLEPGVSQGQLAEHLATHHPTLWMDCSAAGPHASVVGNLLERGFGHTPYGDRFSQCVGLEVVLGTGEVLCTGFSAYPGAAAAHVYAHGVGPVLQGLFTQSSYGVVTRATLWLMPRPEAFEAFFLPLREAGALAQAIDELARLQLEGTLRSKIHIANDLRTASNRGPRVHGHALSASERAALRRRTGAGAWNITGGLYGAPGVVRAERKRLAASDIPGRWLFVNERKRAIFGWLAKRLGRADAWHGATTALDLLQGKPTAAPLAATQWATERPQVDAALEDPSRTDAGLVWIAPVVPAVGRDAQAAISLTERILAEHGFDPLITLTFINPRALCLILQLAFDASVPAQRQAARACHDALLEAYLDAGWVPYRGHPWGHAALRARAPGYWRIAQRIKDVLDPHGIVCPGRYLE